MKTENDKSKGAVKELILWFAFLVSFVTVLTYGFPIIFHNLLRYIGWDMNQKISGLDIIPVFLIIIMIIVFLVYVAGVIWLLFSKLFFTKKEVSKIFFYGPTTSFDRWLFDIFYPPQKDSK